MPAGDRATQRAEAAGPQYPVQHQVGADVRATVPEAPGETAEHEPRQRDREPRDRGLLRQRLQPFDDGGRRLCVLAQMPCQARSEARRGGKECVRTCSSRRSPSHETNNITTYNLTTNTKLYIPVVHLP